MGAMTAGLILWVRAGAASPGFIFFRSPIPMIAYAIGTAVQATAGLVLGLRRPANRQGWITLAFGINVAIGGLIFGFLPWARQEGISAEIQAWAAWLNTWLTLPLGTLLSVWIGFTFPTGRLLSSGWMFGVAVAAVGAVATAVTLALSPGPLVLYPDVVNPLTGAGAGLGPLLPVSLAIFAASAPLTGFALLRRYTVADHIGRLQIRWFVTMSFALEASFAIFLVAVVLLPPHAALGEVILTVLFLSGGLPAVALIFAIFRYRLYDIDTIISRAFVYGVLIAILGALYGASLSLFQRIFTTVTGETSDAALILTTLVLTTSFQPVKNRLEQFFADRFRLGPPPPSEAAMAVLDEPAFVAALDARIAEAMTRVAAPRTAQAMTSTRPPHTSRKRNGP